MGRRKSKASDGTDAERGSSTMSICGRSAATDDLDLYSDEEPDEFADAVESLYEKRASTREGGLQKLVRLMSTQWQYEDCTFKQETLSRLFLSCFKRGASGESALAARALALHVVTLGLSSETEEIFQQALAAMEPVIAKGAKAPDVTVSAIEALSMMCFVAAEGAEETMQVMDLLRKAFIAKNPDVQSAAIRGWTLLLTTVPVWKLGSTFVDDVLKTLGTLLHNDDVEVRAAAGEAITVLYDTCDLSALPESTPLADEEGEAEESPLGAHSVGTVDRLEDIVSRMSLLAKNRGDDTRRSKKDRVVLRSTFRELSAIMEGGDAPEQKVKLRHGDVLVVDTLVGNVQLNAMRAFLADGFQVHLMSNPLLHNVFAFKPSQEAPEKMSAREKRSINSAEGKERSRFMKEARKNKGHGFY